MKTLGKAVRERRKALGLTQQELAMRVKFEDGRSMSETYLCVIEHDLYKPREHKPREHIIAQFARALGTNPDVFFYLAGKVPPDLCELNATREQLEAAFKAFRRVLADARKGILGKPAPDDISRPNGVIRAI